MSNTTEQNFEQKVNAVSDRLKRERDELRLKMHLAKMDAKDEWDMAEVKWAAFEERMKEHKADADDASEEVKTILSDLGDDIARAYKRIRAAL